MLSNLHFFVEFVAQIKSNNRVQLDVILIDIVRPYVLISNETIKMSEK